MENASIEVSLIGHSTFFKIRSGSSASVPILKKSMNADKAVPVVNLPPVRFIDGFTKKGEQVIYREHGIQKYW